MHTISGFTFQKLSNSNNNESFLLLFDGLWKVKAKYIVLCLNALAKLRNAKGASYHPVLMGNTLLLVICISRINPVNELVLLSSRWYAGQETLWSRYGNFIESTIHFFLHCTHFSDQRLTLINKIKDIDKRIFEKNDSLTLPSGEENFQQQLTNLY